VVHAKEVRWRGLPVKLNVFRRRSGRCLDSGGATVEDRSYGGNLKALDLLDDWNRVSRFVEPCRSDFAREQVLPLCEDVQHIDQLGYQAYGKAGGGVLTSRPDPSVDGMEVSCDQVARRD
jgi:hypothetical protein